MKIKTLLLAMLIVLTSTVTLNAQNCYSCNNRNYFEVGDLSFAANYRGVKSYMNILSVENAELHNKLRPQFELIRRKREGAIITATAGGVVGTLMVIGSIPKSRSNNNGFNLEASFPDKGMFIGGLGILTIGGIIAAVIMPRENDFLDFINLHNRNNQNQKIRWNVGFQMWGNNATGLKLQFQF